jgi:hypothetical protein
MGILKGTINCKCDEPIPDRATLKIQVVYIVDNELKKVKVVGRADNLPRQFPIPFVVDYSDEAVPPPSPTLSLSSTLPADAPPHTSYFFLRATIELDGEVLFKNFSLSDAGYYGDLIGRGSKFRKHLDVYLNYVPVSSPTASPAASPLLSLNSSSQLPLLNKIRA